MKQSITILILFFSATALSQNVGIGETNPTAGKLQVKTTDSAALLIQNTATALNTKTALFYKSDNNYSGSIATIQTAPSFYRMGLFTFGGAAASGLKERLSILDGGNVGIGTTNPTAKLEVAGTLKIADGSQGADKVLTSDAAGNASWQSIGSTKGYKYCKQITDAGAGSFTVPAGVTEVMVELWGAGSGAVSTSGSPSFLEQAFYFGGSSGGYASTVQTVTPGANLTYTIGAGSFATVYTSNVANGGNTTLNIAGGAITAYGGQGHIANFFAPGNSQKGFSTLPNYIALYGNTGGYPTFRTEQTTSTEYWKIVTAGNGGAAPGFLNSYFQKGQTFYFLNGVYQYDHYDANSASYFPGSGGVSNINPSKGGDGMILIWYN